MRPCAAAVWDRPSAAAPGDRRAQAESRRRADSDAEHERRRATRPAPVPANMDQDLAADLTDALCVEFGIGLFFCFVIKKFVREIFIIILRS